MKLLLKIFYLFVSAAFLVYLSLPAQGFPSPPPGAAQSDEPADTETPLRRAYFTDLNRQQIMAHYKAQFSNLFTLSLNYPPEEAQTIIRDQTRSSYLEELVHPFRESVFVSGFIPKVRKDAIIIGGKEYYQKITVRYVPSSLVVRIVYGLLISLSGYLLMSATAKLACDYFVWFKKLIWKKRKFR